MESAELAPGLQRAYKKESPKSAREGADLKRKKSIYLSLLGSELALLVA